MSMSLAQLVSFSVNEGHFAPKFNRDDVSSTPYIVMPSLDITTNIVLYAAEEGEVREARKADVSKFFSRFKLAMNCDNCIPAREGLHANTCIHVP